MIDILVVQIAACVKMSDNTLKIVTAAINAGATATTIIAIIGGAGIVAILINKAFKNAGKAVILAA